MGKEKERMNKVKRKVLHKICAKICNIKNLIHSLVLKSNQIFDCSFNHFLVKWIGPISPTLSSRLPIALPARKDTVRTPA